MNTFNVGIGKSWIYFPKKPLKKLEVENFSTITPSEARLFAKASSYCSQSQEPTINNFKALSCKRILPSSCNNHDHMAEVIGW